MTPENIFIIIVAAVSTAIVLPAAIYLKRKKKKSAAMSQNIGAEPAPMIFSTRRNREIINRSYSGGSTSHDHSPSSYPSTSEFWLPGFGAPDHSSASHSGSDFDFGGGSFGGGGGGGSYSDDSGSGSSYDSGNSYDSSSND